MDQQTQQAPHDGLDKMFDGIRGWGFRRRTSGSRWLGGVCAGVADRLNVDPVVVRAAFVLLGLLAGIGVTAYLVLWLLMPDSNGVSAAEKALRHGDGGSVVLLVVTALAVFSGPWWFGHNGVRGLPGVLIVGGLIWWFVAHKRGRLHRSGPGASFEQSATAAGMPPQPATFAGSGAEGDAGAVWQGSAPPYPSSHPHGGSTSTGSVSPARPSAKLPRRSGGLLMTLLGVGAALVAYGLTRWTGDLLGFTGDHRVLALAAALAALGLVVTALGVAGWRTGLLGLLAMILAAVTFAAGSFGNVNRFGGRVGDQVWRPTSATSAGRTGYRLLVGQARLNLTDLPAPTAAGAPAQAATASLPVSVGVGELDVVVPKDLTVRIDSHVGLGQITAPGDDSRDDGGSGGSDVSRSVTVGSGTPQLVVDAQVLVGQITIVKES